MSYSRDVPPSRSCKNSPSNHPRTHPTTVYFTVFDGDNNGSISREELTKVLVHNRRCSQLFGNHARKSTTDTTSSSRSASPAAMAPGAGPVVVVSDDGETAQLVPAAAAGEGGKPALCERTEPRYMEMDPDAYEVAESIAELFESLDTDHDNQVCVDPTYMTKFLHTRQLGDPRHTHTHDNHTGHAGGVLGGRRAAPGVAERVPPGEPVGEGWRAAEGRPGAAAWGAARRGARVIVCVLIIRIGRSGEGIVVLGSWRLDLF